MRRPIDKNAKTPAEANPRFKKWEKNEHFFHE